MIETETLTKTSTDLETEYVLLEAEDPLNRPCEATRNPCSNVAVYRMLWAPSTNSHDSLPVCRCGTNRLCMHCKDWVLSQVSDPGWDSYYCGNCKGFADLKGIEPIRGRA